MIGPFDRLGSYSEKGSLARRVQGAVERWYTDHRRYLVFQGTADGRFIACDATSGKTLRETPTGTGVVAAPSTYMVDGVQYLSIAVGWGGVFGIWDHVTELRTPGTVYTFAIEGKAKLPEFVKYQVENLLEGVPYDPKDLPSLPANSEPLNKGH